MEPLNFIKFKINKYLNRKIIESMNQYYFKMGWNNFGVLNRKLSFEEIKKYAGVALFSCHLPDNIENLDDIELYIDGANMLEKMKWEYTQDKDNFVRDHVIDLEKKKAYELILAPNVIKYYLVYHGTVVDYGYLNATKEDLQNLIICDMDLDKIIENELANISYDTERLICLIANILYVEQSDLANSVLKNNKAYKVYKDFVLANRYIAQIFVRAQNDRSNNLVHTVPERKREEN